MHHRNSSKGLDRRKSTSSVQNKHDSIDPELARQQAHTAATLAFARAQERKSADMGHSGGALSRSNTGNPRQQDRYSSHQQMSTTENTERVVRRQHSVRFVGPTGIQRSQSLGTRATQNPIQRKLSNATLRPMAITTNAPVPAAYRPPSRSSSIGKASVRGGTVEQFVPGDAFDEYYTREDDVASTPSSYRRIRRSKSMFSPLKAPNVFYTNGTPNKPESSYFGGRSAQSYSQTPSAQLKQTSLRAPKSMSFLRGRRDNTQSERNDTAVQLARDRFFHDAEQQRLREQPSFLFRTRAQKQEKAFRKSVRTSSTNSYGYPVASANQPTAPKESGLKDVARKASQTIKNKLRRVFGRNNKDGEPVPIPNQQVDARETHVRQYHGDPSKENETFSNIPHPDEGSLSRVATRLPVIHAANSDQQLRSNAGSIKSFKSESDDKSRVTSWTSAGVNTLASHGPKSLEKEQHQRLSIINEVGSHVPSSSFTRSRLTNQFSAYPLVPQPSKSTGHVQPLAPTPGFVDSARVYSALMKRLDENSPKVKLQASHQPSVESFTNTNHHSNSSSDRTPATIRQVPPSSRNTSNNHSESMEDTNYKIQPQLGNGFRYAGPYTQQWVTAESREPERHADDVFSPKDSAIEKENIPMSQQGRKPGWNASPGGLSCQSSSKASFRTVPEVSALSALTPQETAKRNESVINHPRILREAKSTFFGGGSSYTISRSASPFRRAMTEKDYNPVVLFGNGSLSAHATAPIKNPLYLALEVAAARDAVVNNVQVPEVAYSESVYSRTTSGQTPAAANSSISLVIEKDVPDMPCVNPSYPGDVVILDRTTYRPTMPSGSGHRATSSAGSTEWKKWMSSEVAKLERVKENTNTAYINYALPTMPKSFQSGHVREAAQINDDDLDVPQTKVVAVKQPLGLVQQPNPNIPSVPVLKPILKNRSIVSLVDDPGSAVPQLVIPIPPPPPPPIPPRSPLRQMQSKSSLRSVTTVNTARTASAPNSAIKVSSMSGKNLLHKRNVSQSTIRSTKSSIKGLETPTKLVKRNGRPSVAIPSPGSGLVGAIERQFGSTSTNSRYKTPGSGSVGLGIKEVAGDDDPYDVEGAGLLDSKSARERVSASETEAQVMGSRRMVDLFLSSRRKRMVSESEQSQVFL